MKTTYWMWRRGAIALAGVLLLALPAAAQNTVTSADIQRLQDQVYDASADIARLRDANASQATQLQQQLDDLRDEVTYLKVKLRKEGSVPYAEYTDVRDRIQNVRTQARGGDAARNGSSTWSSSQPTSSGTQPPSSSEPSRPGGMYGGTTDQPTPRSAQNSPNTVPAGQELDVRLQDTLNSKTAQVEDRFQATTMVDLYEGNDVLIPAGSVMRGVVSSVDKATRTDRSGSLTVAFDQITIRGRNFPIRATVTRALESEGMKGEIGKIGAGAGVGAIIGGILGGAKGALLGVLIGGGGTIAATPGKDVTLPAGTVLRVQFDQPLTVQ
ncbi:MAG TPA: hypothetical protein VFK20_15315 [Vicinamibacterales bacterium]|nr:hypothetical protein [Vicinamibacterales bacterium]